MGQQTWNHGKETKSDNTESQIQNQHSRFRGHVAGPWNVDIATLQGVEYKWVDKYTVKLLSEANLSISVRAVVVT